MPTLNLRRLRKDRGKRRGPPWLARLRPSRGRLVAGAGIVLFCGALAWAGAQAPMARLQAWSDDAGRRLATGAGLVVRDIYVSGQQRLAVEDLTRALGVRAGDPLLAFDPHAARERVEALGWVKAATVRRGLPNAVIVEIEEREPLALWQRNGALTLIDRDGVPITRKQLVAWRDLPIVVGEQAPGHVGDLIDALSVQPDLYEQVEAAVHVGARRWNLRLDNGVEINLPEEDMEMAWSRLADAQARDGVLQRDISSIDLRLPDRLVVRLNPSAVERRRQPGEET